MSSPIQPTPQKMWSTRIHLRAEGASRQDVCGMDNAVHGRRRNRELKVPTGERLTWRNAERLIRSGADGSLPTTSLVPRSPEDTPHRPWWFRQ